MISVFYIKLSGTPAMDYIYITSVVLSCVLSSHNKRILYCIVLYVFFSNMTVAHWLQ